MMRKRLKTDYLGSKNFSIKNKNNVLIYAKISKESSVRRGQKTYTMKK